MTAAVSIATQVPTLERLDRPSVVCHLENDCFFIADTSKRRIIYDMKRRDVTAQSKSEFMVTTAVFAQSIGIIASVKYKGVVILDSETLKQKQKLTEVGDCFLRLTMSDSSTLFGIAVERGSRTRKISVWNTSGWERKTYTFDAMHSQFGDLSVDGPSRSVVLSSGKTLEKWTLPEKGDAKQKWGIEDVEINPKFNGRITGFLFFSKWKKTFVAGHATKILVLNAATGKPLSQIETSQSIHSLALSADGKMLFLVILRL